MINEEMLKQAYGVVMSTKDLGIELLNQVINFFIFTSFLELLLNSSVFIFAYILIKFVQGLVDSEEKLNIKKRLLGVKRLVLATSIAIFLFISSSTLSTLGMLMVAPYLFVIQKTAEVSNLVDSQKIKELKQP